MPVICPCLSWATVDELGASGYLAGYFTAQPPETTSLMLTRLMMHAIGIQRFGGLDVEDRTSIGKILSQIAIKNNPNSIFNQ
jgi:hypothetical protein